MKEPFIVISIQANRTFPIRSRRANQSAETYGVTIVEDVILESGVSPKALPKSGCLFDGYVNAQSKVACFTFFAVWMPQNSIYISIIS
jgi:hypothetical protein